MAKSKKQLKEMKNSRFNIMDTKEKEKNLPNLMNPLVSSNLPTLLIQKSLKNQYENNVKNSLYHSTNALDK